MNFLPPPIRFYVVFVLFGLLLIVAGCKSPANNEVQTTAIAPKLMEPLDFAGFTVSDIHSQQGASNLMSQKISVGNNGPDAYVILTTNFDGPRIRVETVNEYKAAIKAGYSAYNTFEIAMQSWFDRAAYTLNFMSKAQPAKRSLVDTKKLKYLPVSFLNWNDSDQKKQLDEDAAKSMTLADYERMGRIKNLKIKGNQLSFEDTSCEYIVTELAKGDYDHDGYEDELVKVSTYYIGGSGRFYNYFIVSETDAKNRKPKLPVLAGELRTLNSAVKTNQFLQCEPNIVKLVGTIQNKVFPGPPNYKSLSKGDLAESYWILKLNEPIDVAEDPEYPVPDENSPQLNVRDVQINLDVYLNADYKAYQQFLDKRVVVTGELTQGFTVHHKTPVMVWVRDIKAAE